MLNHEPGAIGRYEYSTNTDRINVIYRSNIISDFHMLQKIFEKTSENKYINNIYRSIFSVIFICCKNFLKKSVKTNNIFTHMP